MYNVLYIFYSQVPIFFSFFFQNRRRIENANSSQVYTATAISPLLPANTSGRGFTSVLPPQQERGFTPISSPPPSQNTTRRECTPVLQPQQNLSEGGFMPISPPPPPPSQNTSGESTMYRDVNGMWRRRKDNRRKRAEKKYPILFNELHKQLHPRTQASSTSDRLSFPPIQIPSLYDECIIIKDDDNDENW